MRLVEPAISEAKSFTAFFVEEANEAGLFKGPDGKPMVFYRGTQSKKNLFTNLGTLSFTTDPDVAKIYSARPKTKNWTFTADFVEGSTVGAYHLKMTNPIEIDEIDGTPLDFIESYLGGLDKVGRDDVLKLLAYLANRESGKAKGPRFQYEFEDDAEDYIDNDEFMGIEIGSSLKSLYTTVKDRYDDGAMADVKDALNAVVLDYFVLIDAPAFKRLAKAAGYDGIIHTDAFDAGPMVSQKLLGKDVKDQHLTYRPFDKSQVVPLRTQSMATKKDLKESVTATAPLDGYHGSGGPLENNDISVMLKKRDFSHHGSKYGGFYLTAGTDSSSYQSAKRYADDSAARSGNEAKVYKVTLKPDTKFFVNDDAFGATRLSASKIQEYLGQGYQAIYSTKSKPTPELVVLDKSAISSIEEQTLLEESTNPTRARMWYHGTSAKAQKKDIPLAESTASSASLDEIDVNSIDTGVPVKGYLYHGSREDNIEELEPYTPSYDGSLGWGLYLAEEPEAKNYGKYVYRVPVELKKPFRIEHRPIKADPMGDSIETLIDDELLAALKEKGESFKDWYEKWAGFGAEYNQPYGQDVDDVIDEEGNLPEAFLDWMEEADRPLAAQITKHLVEIDEWYGEAIKSAMAEAREKKDPELYKTLTTKLREERKTKLEAINSQKLEDLWDEWPANNIPIIPSSTLAGESVAPFWFRLGDEIFGCFDAGDMESISPSVKEAGYDSMAVHGLRAFSSFLGHEVVLFRSAIPDQVNGEPIQRDE